MACPRRAAWSTPCQSSAAGKGRGSEKDLWVCSLAPSFASREVSARLLSHSCRVSVFQWRE